MVQNRRSRLTRRAFPSRGFEPPTSLAEMCGGMQRCGHGVHLYTVLTVKVALLVLAKRYRTFFFFFGIFHDNNCKSSHISGTEGQCISWSKVLDQIYLRGMLQGMKAEALCVYDLPLSHHPDDSLLIPHPNELFSLSLRAIALSIFFTFFFVAPPSHALDQLHSHYYLPTYLCSPRRVAGSFSSASERHHLGLQKLATYLCCCCCCCWPRRRTGTIIIRHAPHDNAIHPHEHEQL